MVARNDAAQVSLQAQLKARRVRKTYLGLVGGVVDAQLGPHREAHRSRPAQPPAHGRDRRRAAGRDRLPRARALRAAGRSWSSTWSPVAPTRSGSTWRPSATPSPATRSTRRAHAPRARMGSTRLFLHAWRLEFVSPGSGRLVRCEAPLPDELERRPRGAAGRPRRGGLDDPRRRRAAGGAAGHHLRAVGRGQGHHHRGHAAADAAAIRATTSSPSRRAPGGPTRSTA